ncbi:transcriptional activator RfaH [Symmachiella macrocystis]|uniref:Transcriptional activator RfaH n=1 Tax=Symmachiella macrocystis TaxID=2527985 RepID=A0A5C6B457_9PLAN|nr:transcription termination/antitermination NusG family protein [Symmachiella macrocystis]TWU06953.1 transcriptional activator RfaH [Symmachiella macrocystis]
MPILAAETSLFPDDLLENTSQPAADHNWWVIYTRSRQEKALARHLVANEISFYLPLVSKKSLIRSGHVDVHAPLFANYIFMYGSRDDHYSSLKSNRISRILPVHEPERLCADLLRLRRLIETEAPVTLESRLSAGRAVRVRSGAFAGTEGTVISRRGKTRLVVEVNFLQQGASIEIDDFLLEPLD